MNEIIITGNLTRDPEIRTTQTGIKVCAMTVAVNDRVGDQDQTQFVNVSVWRQQAESCAAYLKKGRKVLVRGRARVHAWNRREDGSAAACIEIDADKVEFLSRKTDDGESAPAPAEETEKPARTQQERMDFSENTDDDDLPF